MSRGGKKKKNKIAKIGENQETEQKPSESLSESQVNDEFVINGEEISTLSSSNVAVTLVEEADGDKLEPEDSGEWIITSNTALPSTVPPSTECSEILGTSSSWTSFFFGPWGK